MTLKVRRMLSLVFILLFLIISPAIVLYAAGFRLSKDSLAIQRTGMFIIDSKPRGAKIFLNNKIQKDFIGSLFNKDSLITTPAKIKNLLPGEYELSLKLNGYWGWQKKLTVNPGASTFIEDIYLFKNDLPIQIMPAKIKLMSLSPNKNKILVLSAGQASFLNLADEAKKLINNYRLKGDNLAWSPDSQKIVIDNYLYDLSDLSSETDLSKFKAGLFNYKWGDNYLFFQDKSAIYRLSNKNFLEKIINNIQFNDYLIKEGYLYLISQAKLATSLKVIDLASKKFVKNINLPASAGYSFINPEHALLNLYDNNQEILYLIDPAAAYYSPLTEIINNLKTTFWTNDNNLLYTNDFEIWLFNLATKNRTLITRISKIINGAIMHPSKNYIIYSTSQTINAIELDERQKRNSTELVKSDSINSTVLNPEGNIIYFSGKIGHSEGLYKSLIQ